MTPERRSPELSPTPEEVAALRLLEEKLKPFIGKEGRQSILKYQSRHGDCRELAEALEPGDLELIRTLSENRLATKIQFLCDPHLVRFARQVRSEQYWREHRLEDLKALNLDDSVYPASLILSYSALTHYRNLNDWITQNQLEGPAAFVALWALEMHNDHASLWSLLDSPMRDRLIAGLRPADLVQLAKLLGAQFLLAHPEVCLELAQEAPKYWQERLLAWHRIIPALELGTVPDAAINQEVMAAYLTDLKTRIQAGQIEETREERERLRLAATDPAAKVAYIASLRAGAAKGLPQIKRELVNSGRGRDISLNQEHWQRRLERAAVDRWEHPRHPLHHLLATTGFEIEFEVPRQVSTQALRLAAKLGVRSGIVHSFTNNLAEVSPGPFWHYRTAQAVFWSLVQSEIVDLYSAFGQSVHFNVGLHTGDGFTLLVRWLMATGDAYLPFFANENITESQFDLANDAMDYGQHVLRLHPNDNGFGEYYEAKEFALLTPRGMARHLKQGALLGSALKCFQQALVLEDPSFHSRDADNYYYTQHIFNDLVDDFSDIPFGEQRQLADSPWLTEDERRLAGIWVKYSHLFQLGLNQLGLGNLTKRMVNNDDAGIFVDHLRLVLPDYWSRYAVVPRQQAVAPLTLKRKRYANLVDLARTLARQASREIEAVVDQADTELAAEVARISQLSDGHPRQLKAIRTLFDRYRTIPDEEEGEDSSDTQMYSRFEDLRQLYLK